MHDFTRFVALGDSFTEGVGDDDPQSPNGVRGWADRVAEELRRDQPDLFYANLAIRGRVMQQVIDEQVPRALELRPDLVTICIGGNDLMRTRVDIDELVGHYAEALAPLVSSGARVLTFTSHDVGWSPVFRVLRGRAAVYNELLREVCDDLGVEIVDFWRMKGYDDPRMWAFDKLHMSPVGHSRMAREVLTVLGAEHTITLPELGPLPAVDRLAKRREDLAWTREFLAPWIGRRVRGTSSGDGISAKADVQTSVIDLRERSDAS